MREISARKAAEEQARASEQRLRSYVAHATDIVYTLGLDGRFQYISPNCKEKLGLEPAEIVGRSFTELLHPDDVDACTAFFERFLSGQTDADSIEYRARHTDGGWRWNISHMSPLNDDEGRLLGVIGVGHDIARRKEAELALRQSEERYRLLAENANDVIWTMALDGTVTYISPSIERVRGFTAEEAMRQTLEETLTPRSQADSIDYVVKLHLAIAEGAIPAPYRGEMEYLRRDGSIFHADVQAVPVMGADGQVKEILGVSRDLTERKKHEAEILRINDELRRHRDHLDELVLERTRQLAAARDAAEGANRAKTALLANVSHELRTPLNHISGFAQLLTLDQTDPEQTEYAQTIVDSSAHLLRLVDSLLDTARLESNALALESKELDLRAVIEHAVAGHRKHARDKGIALEIALDAGLPHRLIGDAVRMGAVLDQLIDNALKFSDGGSIRVGARCVDLHGGHADLRFEIEDEGIGFTDEQRKRLFRPFELGDDSSTRRHGGAGLGLALCSRIVALMAGEIGIEPRTPRGSQVWVALTLPVGNAPAAEASI